MTDTGVRKIRRQRTRKRRSSQSPFNLGFFMRIVVLYSTLRPLMIGSNLGLVLAPMDYLFYLSDFFWDFCRDWSTHFFTFY